MLLYGKNILLFSRQKSIIFNIITPQKYRANRTQIETISHCISDHPRDRKADEQMFCYRESISFGIGEPSPYDP